MVKRVFFTPISIALISGCQFVAGISDRSAGEAGAANAGGASGANAGAGTADTPRGGHSGAGAGLGGDGGTPSAECGDGLVDTGETCDDGNRELDDGCDGACGHEDGWTCDEGSPTHCTEQCGDGLLVGGERLADACDDENLDDGDGCSSSCAIEEGYACEREPSECELVNPCVIDNGGCEQRCSAEDGVSVCGCGAGYRLEPDERTCRLAQWSPLPTALLTKRYANDEDVHLWPLAVAPSGAAQVVLRGANLSASRGWSLHSRVYTPGEGWSRALSSVPESSSYSPVDVRLAVLDDTRAVLAWDHRMIAESVYSSVWADGAWSVPEVRDVENQDGVYSMDLSWDGAERVYLAWHLYTCRFQLHVWVDEYHRTNGWGVPKPMTPYLCNDPNAGEERDGQVLSLGPEHALVVALPADATDMTLLYRDLERNQEAAPVPLNPQPGTTFRLVGNRRGVGYVVTSGPGTCRALRYTRNVGFSAGSLPSAEDGRAACPVLVDEEGTAFTIWVDADGGLQLARALATSADDDHPAGAWEPAEKIADASPNGIANPLLRVNTTTGDMAAIWLTTTAPVRLMGSIYVEGSGWSTPRRLSNDGVHAVIDGRTDLSRRGADAVQLEMDAAGDAIAVFSQPFDNPNAGIVTDAIWAAHLR